MTKWLSKKPYAVLVFIFFSIMTISLSLSFNYLSEPLPTGISAGIYDKSFWVNLLINLNSSIVDFFFLGLIILYFDKKNQKQVEDEKSQNFIKEKVGTLRRDLKDYAEHSTIELDLRKAGILRDLCALNEVGIHIRKIKIHGVDLKNIKLNDSDLSGLSLYQSKLENFEFKNCTLRSLNLMEGTSKKLKFSNCIIRNMKLTQGKFKAIEFENCSLINSRMNNADLSSAIFENCDLQDATFENSNLRSANFKGCKNIDPILLSKAACLDYIVIEGEILTKLKTLKDGMKIKRK